MAFKIDYVPPPFEKILELSDSYSAIPVENVRDRRMATPAEETLSDGDLVRRSAKGDEAAFTALYRRHQGPVFRFALHMSGRKELAEEITQEVFLALICEAARYRPERGSLQALLIGVARNKIRRCLRDPEFELGDVDMAGTEADLFERCSKSGELAALQSAILSLPPRYREVIVLCDLEEMPYADVARLLSCVVGTVRSRLHRGRGILSAKLRKREGCSV